MASQPRTNDHASLMDTIYRWQRPVYDVTRKYYLFGRDRLIRTLDARPGMAVLELGCGTGRNLELIGRAWPGVHVHGLDISSEMLKSAHKRLDRTGVLALGDATVFDSVALFGRTGFDRIVLSYAVSMIPDWQAALRHAAATLSAGGALHIVDFGDGMGLPRPARVALHSWLARFHVTPRLELARVARDLGHAHGLRCEVIAGSLGYYQLVRLSR